MKAIILAIVYMALAPVAFAGETTDNSADYSYAANYSVDEEKELIAQAVICATAEKYCKDTMNNLGYITILQYALDSGRYQERSQKRFRHFIEIFEQRELELQTKIEAMKENIARYEEIRRRNFQTAERIKR